jgi:hypothetical protein
LNTPTAYPPPARTNRKLLWLIPGGCLALLLIFGLFAGALMMFVLSLMKNSGAYEDAMELAGSHPAVIEVTGEPIEAGFLVTGEINTSGATGSANLSIPISGPRGSGRLHLQSTKNGGEWYFDRLQFLEESGGPPVDLLASE